MIERPALEAALEGVRALVAADGGDLVLSAVDGDTARLRLVLDSAECRECVMPGVFLERVALDIMGPDVPGLVTVEVDDPREGGPPA